MRFPMLAEYAPGMKPAWQLANDKASVHLTVRALSKQCVPSGFLVDEAPRCYN